MSAADTDAINRALEFSKQMLTGAKEGNWELVAKLDSERQQLITANISNADPIDPESPDGLLIQEILTIHAEIESLADKAKSEIQDELIELSRARNQAKTYQGK